MGYGATYAGSGGIGPPSGMTERGEIIFNTNYYMTSELCSVVQASAGSTGDKTFSFHSFANPGWIAGLIAIKGAEAAVTGKHNTFEGGSVDNTISPANSGTSGTAFDNVVIT